MLANSDMPEDILKDIYNTAIKYDNSDLILAIIKVESHFNPLTKSHQKAKGLMGITPKWWLEELKSKGIIKTKRDLYNIEKNIEGGNYILSKYFEKHKNIYTVLTNYSGNAKNYPEKVLIALGEINYARIKGTW